MSKSTFNPKWTKAQRAELEQAMDGVVNSAAPLKIGDDGVVRWSWHGLGRTLWVDRAHDKIVITVQQATGAAVSTVYEGRDGDADQPHYRDDPGTAICMATLAAKLNILPA